MSTEQLISLFQAGLDYQNQKFEKQFEIMKQIKEQISPYLEKIKKEFFNLI